MRKTTILASLFGLTLGVAHGQGTFASTSSDVSATKPATDSADQSYWNNPTGVSGSSSQDKWFYENSGAGQPKGQTWTTTQDILVNALSFRLKSTRKAAVNNYLIRIGAVDTATNTFTELHSETIEQTADWNPSGLMDSVGTWTLDTPVALPVNPATGSTMYAIDVTFVGPSNTDWQGGGIPYPRFDNSDVFPGGYRYTTPLGGGAGIPTNTMQPSNADREFHLDMDATTITDTTDPGVLVIDDSGSPIFEDQLTYTYTIGFDDAVDASTIDVTDFTNLGSGVSLDGIQSITETTPFPVNSVLQIEFLISGTGTLQLEVNDNSILDNYGNPLASSFADTETITVLSGTTVDDGRRWWDGTNTGGIGDGISQGGGGTWTDSGALAWDRGAGFAKVAWDNSNLADTAIFGGNNGQVNLGEDINVGQIVFGDLDSTFTLEDNGANKLIFPPSAPGFLLNDPSANREFRIRTGFTGNPDLTMHAGEYMRTDLGSVTGNVQNFGDLNFKPQADGSADCLVRVYTTGTGYNGSFQDVNIDTTNNGRRSLLEVRNNGTWAISGGVNGTFNTRMRLHLHNSSRTIVTGDITRTEVNMANQNATLELRKSGSLSFDASTFNRLRGTIDNASGGPLAFTGNPSATFENTNLDLDGDSLDFGTGNVNMNNRTMTISVTEPTSTLTFGGNWSNCGNPTTFDGPGTVELSGSNTYVGATNVTGGTLHLSGGSSTSPIAVSGGAKIGFTVGNTVTSTSTLDLGSGTVAIFGTPVDTSYTLISTSSSIAGTATLDAPIAGYSLVVDGNDLKLVSGGGGGGSAFNSWAASNGVPPNSEAVDSDLGGQNNQYEFALGGTPTDGNDDGSLLNAFSSEVDGGSAGPEGVLTILVRSGASFSASSGNQVATIDGVVYTVSAESTLPVAGGLSVSVSGTTVTDGLPSAPTGYEYASFYVTGVEGYFQVTVETAP